MANDIITQLQARNETLTQAIARYGSLNASTLQTLNIEQITVTRLMQQLADSALRWEKNDKQRTEQLKKAHSFAGQFGKLPIVETPDWRLPDEFQGKMVEMATKGGMDSAIQNTLNLNLRDWSLEFNQDQKTLQSAASTMIEGGVSALPDLNRYMPDIAKAATATRDNAQTWALAALATRDKLNIPPEDFHLAQNMMYSVAKNGGGSVKEQTRWINSAAGKTGTHGIEGLADIMATMQIAMTNTLNPAATAETINLTTMLANRDEYQQLKASAIQDAGQNLINDEFSARMSSSLEQTKALQLSLNDLWLSVGLQLMPVFGELAQCVTPLVRQFSAWLRENPVLVQGIAKAIGVIWLFNGALNLLTLGLNLIASPFIRLVDVFLKVKASLALGSMASTTLSLLKFFGNGAKNLAILLGRSLVSGLMLAGNAFIWLGRALMMNPVGLIITAIAGAAYLIYRYWEPLSGFFSGIWSRIQNTFDGGIGGITRLIMDWSPLGLFYSAFSSVLDRFGIELPASFSEFGSNILDSLVNGILDALPFLNGAIEKIKGMIPDWAKNTPGISTESSVVATTRSEITGLAQSVSSTLVPISKTSVSPQVAAAKAAPTSVALPGKSGEKTYALPSRTQSNVQVHFSPQVTVQGSGANIARDINNVLSLSKRELERMINDVMAQQRRREYA